MYHRGAALLALVTGVAELAIAPSMLTAFACVIVSGATAVYTRTANFTVLYRLSLLCMLGGLGYHVYFAINALDLGGWIGLVLLGTTAIVLAAAVERHGDRMKHFLVGVLRTQ